MVTHFLRFVIHFIYRNTTGSIYPAAFSPSIFVIIARNASGKARLFMGQPATQRMQLMHRSLSVWLGSARGMAPVGHPSVQEDDPVFSRDAPSGSNLGLPSVPIHGKIIPTIRG